MSNTRPVQTPRWSSDSSSGGFSILSASTNTSGPRTPGPSASVLPEPYYVQSPPGSRETSSGLPIGSEQGYYETDGRGLPTYLKARGSDLPPHDSPVLQEGNAPVAKLTARQLPAQVEQVTSVPAPAPNVTLRYRTPPPPIQAARPPSAGRFPVPVNPDDQMEDPRNLEIEDPNASDSTESDREPDRTPVPPRRVETRMTSPDNSRLTHELQRRVPIAPPDNQKGMNDGQVRLPPSAPETAKAIVDTQVQAPFPRPANVKAPKDDPFRAADPELGPKVHDFAYPYRPVAQGSRAPPVPPRPTQEQLRRRGLVVSQTSSALVPQPTPVLAPEAPPAPVLQSTRAGDQSTHTISPPTHAPAIQPAPAPALQPTPAPALQLAAARGVQPAAAPGVQPATAPGVQPVPAPGVQRTPARALQPTPAPARQPAPARGVQPAAAPGAQPAPATGVQPTPAPGVQPTPAPGVQPTPAPGVQPIPALDVQPTPAPVLQPSAVIPSEPGSEVSIQQKLDALLHELAVPIVEARKKDENPVNGGAFADVWRGIMQPGDQPVALKILRLHLRGTDSHRLYRAIAREVSVWARLDDKNVLPFLGVRPQDDWNSLWLVSPWMESGDIKTYLMTNPHVDRLNLASGVTSGVAYLHRNKIAHGDLKANNILVDSEGQPRLADFGLSLVLDDVLPEQTTSTMFAGSVRWMSPERIQPARFGLTPASSRTLAGDVYSLAMTLYEIFTLTLPYHELTQMDVPRAIVSGDRPPHPGDAAVQLGLTDDMWNFMRKCWSEQPHDRPDLAILSDDSDESKSDNEDTDDGKAPPANIETFSPETSNPKIDTNVPTKATEVTGPASFGVDKVPPSVLTQDPVPAASSGFRSQSRQSISASDSPLQQSFTQGADAAIPDIEEKSGLVTDTSVGAFNEHPTPPSSSAALASHDDKIRRLAMPKKASARDDPSRLEGAKGEDHLPSMHNILPPATAAFDTLSQQPAPPPPASDQNTIQSHGDINLPPVLPMSGGRGRATPTNDLQTTQKSEPGNDLTVREERGTSTASQTGPASLQHVVPEYGTEVKVDMEQVPPNVSPQVEPSTAPLTSTSSFKSRNPFRPRTVSQPNMEEPSFPAGRHRDVSSEGNVAAMAAANTLASTAESLSNTVVMAAQHPAVSQSVHSETVTAPIAEGRSSPDTLKASTSPAEDTSISAEHSIPTPEREVAPTTVKVPTVSNPAVPQPSAPASSAFEDIWKLLQAEIMEQKPISRPLPQHIPARPDGPPLPSIPARANSFEEVVRIEANAAGIHVPPRPSLSPSSVSARPILKRGDSKHTGHEPAKPNTRTVAWDDIVTDSERTPTGRKVGETRRDMGKMDAKTAAWDDYLTDSELTPTLRRYAPLLPRVGRLAAVEEHSTPPRRPSPVYQGSMHTPLQSSSPKPQGQLSTTVETTQSENEDESRTLSKEKTSGYMKPRSESPQTWSEVKSGVAKSIPDEIRSSSRESDYRSAVAGLVEKVHPEPTKHDQSGTSSGTTGNLIDFDDPSPAPSHAPNTSNDISWGFQHDGEVSDVMISQLDKTISKNRLKRLFERFGEVLHVNITVDSRGVSTGDACVSFANHSDALLAVQQMNDETIGTGQIQVWALGL